MIDSILLIGQSNMAGRGFLTPENRIANARIKKLVNGKWLSMFEPVNPDRVTAGANLAPTFALEYLKYTENEVGLIPAADGGTCIAEWQKGEPLYDNAVFQAKMAMRSSELKAILWHQGETDSHADRVPLYKERFLKMLDDLKADLGLPDIKIYVGGLGEYLVNYNPGSELSYLWKDINDILMEIANERDDVIFVPSDGLTSNPDNLHFNTESLREFGRRYFDAYAKENPEFVAKINDLDIEADDITDAKFAEVKAKFEKGEISKEQYDRYFKKYIESL